jgi:Fe-S-cluster containining protein
VSLPSPEIVERSIHMNLRGIADCQEELETLIVDEAESVLTMEAELTVKHQRLMVVVKRAGELVAPIAACKRGCDHCCKMAVTISSHEAAMIGKAIGVEPVKAPTRDDQFGMVNEYMNVPCPFLKKKECSIYENRPLPCRTHFNISSFPDLCDTVNYPGSDVPNVDLRSLTFVDSAISYETCTLNDIRAYFPEGANPVQSL